MATASRIRGETHASTFGSYRAHRRPLVAPVFVALLITSLSLIPLGVAGAGRSISGATNFSATVLSDDYDKFPVTAGSGKILSLSVSISTGGNADFYILDASDLSQYEAPNSTGFTYTASREDTRSYSYTFSNSPLTLVVDNVDFSTTGATPTGDITYQVTVTETDVAGAVGAVVTGFLVLLLLVIIIIVVAVVVVKKRKAPTPPPPPPMGQYGQQPGYPGYGQPQQPGYYAPQQPQQPAPYDPQPYQPPPPYNPPPPPGY